MMRSRQANYLSLKKSYHTFTDVTNAYFHVDEDGKQHWESDFCVMETAKTSVRTATRWNTLRRLHGRHLDEQSLDRCEAAPQFFVNYALDVPIEVHMYDLHGNGPKTALDLSRINLSQTIRFNVRTVYEMGTRYEHLKRERVLHEDRTEIVPNPKYLRVVLRSMGLTTCKPAPAPSVTESVM